MATTVLPIVRVGNDIGEIQGSLVLDGSVNDMVLVARQAGAALTLLSTDTLIDGSQYLWESIIVPYGRSIYFEVVASGVNLGAAVGVTIGLYAGATLVTGSALTVTSTTSARSRSAAITLTNNVEYSVKYRTGGLVGSAFVYSARLLIR